MVIPKFFICDFSKLTIRSARNGMKLDGPLYGEGQKPDHRCHLLQETFASILCQKPVIFQNC